MTMTQLMEQNGIPGAFVYLIGNGLRAKGIDPDGQVCLRLDAEQQKVSLTIDDRPIMDGGFREIEAFINEPDGGSTAAVPGGAAPGLAGVPG